MPRDASGTYTLPIAPFQPLTLAKSADMNTALTDIADALTDSQSRANPTPAQGDLDMNGQDIVNAGNITAGNTIFAANVEAQNLTADATVFAANVEAQNVTADATVFAQNVSTVNLTASGNVNGATVSATGQVFAGTNLIVGNDLTTGHSANIGQFLTVGGGMRLHGISPYPDNAAALAAGHAVADVYFNTTSNALSVVL